MLRSQCQIVTCPGHERCSATLRAVDPISEYAFGKQIGHSFAQGNVVIRSVASDGDVLASRGVHDAMPAVPIERQADTTHLGQKQFRNHESFILPPPPECFCEKQPSSEQKRKLCLLKIRRPDARRSTQVCTHCIPVTLLPSLLRCQR